ncbi:hypothetical protein HYV12_03085 [Candidatus Dojkabacteria bacterium]|nr:hypothetical protein [Candidatus Dojkabacteria bacterium]
MSKSNSLLTRNYFILIPLLREQEVLPRLLNIFSKLNGDYKLIFITSKKEEFEHKNNRGTFKKDVVRKILKFNSLDGFLEASLGYFYEGYAKQVYERLQNIPDNQKEQFLLKMYNEKPLTQDILEVMLAKTPNDKVEILKYPKIKGVMAHQLNYACAYIRKKYSGQNNMICIYNADSVIQKNHLEILQNISGNTIQQSSLFLKNFQEPSGSLRKAFLKGNGMLQSRWTLAHEIPRIHSQRKSNILNFLELFHVVRHGLAIDLETLEKVGDFPTKFFNEDLPLGYMLRVNNEFVDIYPSLENADTPSTIKGVFTQYRTWFYGVAYYPKYYTYALKSFNLSPKYKIYAFFWATRGVLRSVQWLLTSFYWVFIFLYPILISDLKLFSIAFSSFLFYSLLSWVLTFRSIKKYPYLFPEQTNLELSVLDWLSVFPVYLTHSWGLILGFADVFKNVVIGTNIIKRKTER